MIDPASGRAGPGSLLVEDGRVAELTWARRRPSRAPDVIVLPGLIDLHAHLREPGAGDAETIRSGLAAAAAGGFTTVCAMPNTDPPVADAAAVRDVLARGRASGSPVRLLTYGTTTAGRAGERLAPMGELADAGAIGFSDDGAPVDDPALFRQALAYAGGVGRPLVEHPEVRVLTRGAEAHEGLAATILGLQGWPVAAEAAAVATALALLDEVARQAPPGAAPRLHLTHVSTADALALIRLARSAGLAVTCDVTPHHLALHDGWLGGDRRFAWAAADAPWAGGPAKAPPYDTATRVNPPLRSPDHALALWAGLADGTVDAIATDHAPHPETAKRVEFGDAATGIAGLETALPLLLAGVAAGLADLSAVVTALTTGPLRAMGLLAHGVPLPSLAVGSPADLVIVDRAASWTVDPAALRSLGRNTPLAGLALPGRILATVARGRLAYLDDAWARDEAR
ncbi:MAG: dihydroorotase [Candidatus Limnocylindrales bacterium]